jgi:diaminopimelate epimerase
MDVNEATMIAVCKMHGAGNDFVVVDTRRVRFADAGAFARWTCDRHSGIGADGVLMVGESARADAAMRVINADGSEAEMCGNGIRCVARYLDERGEGSSLTIDTAAGLIRTEVLARGQEYRVKVVMGVPQIEVEATSPSEAAIVNVGNLHAVFSCDSFERVDLEREAARLRERFPDGINVHAMVVEPSDVLRVRHYERGAGYTMACGTGAVACAVVAMHNGARSPLRVVVPGGELVIEWNGKDAAFMTGPAVHVFDTTIDLRSWLQG